MLLAVLNKPLMMFLILILMSMFLLLKHLAMFVIANQFGR